MINSDSSQKWIEAGYELFATEGKEGVLIEKLARKLGRNIETVRRTKTIPEIVPISKNLRPF